MKSRYATMLAPCLCMMALSACDQINGSYEEAMESGRLNSVIEDGGKRRFFRFHLRQFDDAIGGTFESFDMSGYSAFSQVPVVMANSTSFYYCARIDYGYVRDDLIHIIFTDREQRQWTFSAKGSDRLSGRIRRNQSFSDSMMIDADPEYLLAEDAAFVRNGAIVPSTGALAKSQVVLNRMKKLSDRPLDCVYYFKKREIDFVLPAELLAGACEPSQKQCRSLKLAIVGSPAMQRIDAAQNSMRDVQTAYLDDCDISEGGTRRFILRDNPYASSPSRYGEVFVATAVVYEDFDRDDMWDGGEEPILAALSDQVLIFYPETLTSSYYAKTVDGTSQEIPIVDADSSDVSAGWHLYNDISDRLDMPWRTLARLTEERSERMYLKPVRLEPDRPADQRGCYVTPSSDSQARCIGILPVLLY